MKKNQLLFAGLAGLTIVILVFAIAVLNLQRQKPSPDNLLPTTYNLSPFDSPTLAQGKPTAQINENNGDASASAYATTYELMKERDRKNNPDIFLANNLPFENEKFKLEYTWLSDGSFQFRVTNKAKLSQAALKREVEDWLLELKLTREQIKQLKIKY